MKLTTLINKAELTALAYSYAEASYTQRIADKALQELASLYLFSSLRSVFSTTQER